MKKIWMKLGAILTASMFAVPLVACGNSGVGSKDNDNNNNDDETNNNQNPENPDANDDGDEVEAEELSYWGISGVWLGRTRKEAEQELRSRIYYNTSSPYAVIWLKRNANNPTKSEETVIKREFTSDEEIEIWFNDYFLGESGDIFETLTEYKDGFYTFDYRGGQRTIKVPKVEERWLNPKYYVKNWWAYLWDDEGNRLS